MRWTRVMPAPLRGILCMPLDDETVADTNLSLYYEIYGVKFTRVILCLRYLREHVNTKTLSR